MSATKNEDGTLTFHTDYLAVWHEPQNEHYRKELRARLSAGKPASIVFQPGDGTRYEFMLIPDAPAVTISDGREAGMSLSDGNLLRAVVLNYMGDGVGTFHRRSYGDEGTEMANARYRISDKMSVPNACTAEALASTITALWYQKD